MKFGAYLAKRKIEDLLILPFIKAGRKKQAQSPSKEYDIYFFFPFYHTGGAENVHAQIVKAAGGKNCVIFFTRKSKDERFLADFKQSGCDIIDISGHTDTKFKYHENLAWRGRVSQMINSQSKKPVVFNGQCNFAYKLSPWIRKDIKQVELIHSFNTFSWIRLPFLPFISRTVMISRRRIEEHLRQYKKLGLPNTYADRISFIQNAIELPAQDCGKEFNDPKILFVGRGTPEKRPELFLFIARRLPGLRFTLVGEMPEHILSALPPNVEFTGNISNEDALHRIYCSHQVLIIPSSTEGFPIVLMEAMARGCAVMATPVGDIPYHLDNQKGLLFSSTEAKVVEDEAVKWLQSLAPQALQEISDHCRMYAKENFGIDQFNQQYKAILQP